MGELLRHFDTNAGLVQIQKKISAAKSIGVGAQSTLGEARHFARKIRKYMYEKISKMPECYTIFARKMPKFYMIIARNIFPRILGATCPPSPRPVSCGFMTRRWTSEQVRLTALWRVGGYKDAVILIAVEDTYSVDETGPAVVNDERRFQITGPVPGVQFTTRASVIRFYRSCSSTPAVLSPENNLPTELSQANHLF